MCNRLEQLDQSLLEELDTDISQSLTQESYHHEHYVGKRAVFEVFSEDEELDEVQDAASIFSDKALMQELSDKESARKLMDTWLEVHLDDPYLKEGDAEALAHLTGLTPQQVRRYMNNARLRKLPKVDVPPPRVASGASLHSIGSSSSLGARKGRKKYRSSDASLSSLAKSSISKDKPYQCTWCGDPFGRKSDWKRHEQSTHLPQQEWICMPSYPAKVNDKGLSICEFCDLQFTYSNGRDMFMFPTPLSPNSDVEIHLREQHKYASCFSKPISERTFTRKDKLRQHLAQVHNVYNMTRFMVTGWKRSVNRNVQFNCGFCGIQLDGWDKRMNHIAQHFESGDDVSSWRWSIAQGRTELGRLPAIPTEDQTDVQQIPDTV